MNNSIINQRPIKPLFAIITFLIFIYSILNKDIYYQIAAGIAFLLAAGLYAYAKFATNKLKK